MMSLFFMAAACYGVGIFTLLFPHKWQKAAHYAACVAAIAGSGLVTYNAGLVLLDILQIATVQWGSYSLSCDKWSAAFLLLTGCAGIITSIYALGYALSYLGKRLRMLGSLWNLFLGSMVFVVLAGDAFSFLLFWEIMAVASFLLVNHEAEKRVTWNAAYQYLVMTHIGTAAIMIAFLLTGTYSKSFAFADMANNTLSDGMSSIVFLAAFIGFALKAGLVPLHVWLPKAHPAAPSHVSALMSGVMLKIALYGFGRFVFAFLPDWNYWWCIVVMTAGLISAFLGVLYAQMETDIKRILAYSSVENMGIIFAAFGCGMLLEVTAGEGWGTLGFMAALVHCYNHSVIKVLMFMSAGSIMHATGSKNLELFGGLLRKLPYTAAFCFVGCMALSALPLTNGFIGEWMTLQSFITLAYSGYGQDIRLWCSLAFVLLGLTGALALGCFVRFFGIAFLGRARSQIAEQAHESDGFMLLAMGISTILIFALGLYPAPLLNVLSGVLTVDTSVYMPGIADVLQSSGELLQAYGTTLALVVVLAGACFAAAVTMAKKSYVASDVTWNCGTVPTARQQYSATGFSKPLRRAFDYLLKPKREVSYVRKDHPYFGRLLSYKLEIPDMITQKLYLPLQKYFVVSSAFLRRLQQGSVRLYVSYVMAAMIAVLIWGAIYK